MREIIIEVSDDQYQSLEAEAARVRSHSVECLIRAIISGRAGVATESTNDFDGLRRNMIAVELPCLHSTAIGQATT